MKILGSVHYYDDKFDEDDDLEDQRHREKTVNPSIGRRYSLAVPNPRIRSNSIAIYNDDEEDVVFTSFGPVILEPVRNGMLKTQNNPEILFILVFSQERLDAWRFLGNSQWNFVHSW